MKKKRIISIVIAVALAAAAGIFFVQSRSKTEQPSQKKTSTTQKKKVVEEKTPEFDKTLHSTTDPTSLWVIVNKQHPLNPQTYNPNDLIFPNVSLRIPGAEQMKMRKEAAAALEQMFQDASSAGFKLQITTAYRGYSYQKTLYDNYVAEQGKAIADTQSARPGYSEHQTGWAVDIRPQSGKCYLEACFGDMEEGKWLAAHAYQYGFILRYPESKTNITGYTYEPWHFRYVGKELAAEMHKQNILTLEEFFQLGPAPDYKQ